MHCTLCGLGPVLIVMQVARELGANKVEVLRYANSGDAPMGDKNRCVGYCAVALCEVGGRPAPKVEPLVKPTQKDGEQGMTTSEGELNEEQQKYLYDLAKETIQAWVAEGRKVKPERREGILGEAPPKPAKKKVVRKKKAASKATRKVKAKKKAPKRKASQPPAADGFDAGL